MRREAGQFCSHRVPGGSRAFATVPAKAEPASMLPGFRFLFAAIVLSMSILIFGLGAAALLRAAHEQFASIPTRRPVPETLFAQQPNEASNPVLAMLRVEAQPVAQNIPDKAPAGETPAEPAAVASAPAEPEQIAAPKPEPSSPQETIAKP